jgi:hypothetical protein
MWEHHCWHSLRVRVRAWRSETASEISEGWREMKEKDLPISSVKGAETESDTMEQPDGHLQPLHSLPLFAKVEAQCMRSADRGRRAERAARSGQSRSIQAPSVANKLREAGAIVTLCCLRFASTTLPLPHHYPPPPSSPCSRDWRKKGAPKLLIPLPPRPPPPHTQTNACAQTPV